MKQFFITFAAVMLGLSIFLLLPMLILIGIAMAASSDKEKVEVKEGSFLVLDLSHSIKDRVSDKPFDIFKELAYDQEESLGLDEITDVLRDAEDSKIAGLMLKGENAGAGVTTLRELRQAVVDFKANSGKPVIYFANTTSAGAMYVASVADSVFITPGGKAVLQGVTMQKTYFKGLADKLGIGFDVLKHGRFKSAVEPYFRKDMSPEDELQSRRIVDILWQEVRDSIASGRGISASIVDDYVNNLSFTTSEGALKAGLVDGTLYYDQLQDRLRGILGKGKGDKVRTVSVSKYATANSEPSLPVGQKGDEVAVVYALGGIEDGKGDDTSEGIFGDDMSSTLRKLRGDSSVKAVVLRVNSPGGSALASDLIWREVELLKAEKPVVVSMGDYAASGGYYISCAANYIYAQPTTLTGSIGVFGLVPNAEKMVGDFGVGVQAVSSSQQPFMTPFKALTPAQTNALQKSVDETYGTFIRNVANGRNLTIDGVDSIAQGRVWTGIDAKEIGLVDELGGLDDAIEMAVELAGLDDYNIGSYPEDDDSPWAVLKQLKVSMSMRSLAPIVGSDLSLLRSLRKGDYVPSARTECEYTLKLY